MSLSVHVITPASKSYNHQIITPTICMCSNKKAKIKLYEYATQADGSNIFLARPSRTTESEAENGGRKEKRK